MSNDFPTMGLNDVQKHFAANDFQNGMHYYDTHKVLNPSRYQNKLFAQVQGSGATNYNVIIEFDQDVKPKCTCPAARRNRFCKHVAAVLVGWARAANGFAFSDDAPALSIPTKKKARVKQGKVNTDDLIARGLESLETLTTELALSGLSSITTGRVEQVKDLAENLRTYKLRRLSTLLTQFADTLNLLQTDKEKFSLAAYAELLSDIVLTAKGVQAIRQGKLQDPKYMEELVGKTWTDKELTPRSDLELIELFFDIQETPDKFRVFSSYFVDVKNGELLTEKLIIPVHLKKGPNTAKPSYTGKKLIVSDATQYPGFPPLRLKLKQFDESRITLADVDEIASHAQGEFGKAIEAFKTYKKDVFAPSDYYTLLRPEGFYASEQGLSIFDAAGTAFALLLTERSALYLEQALESSLIRALFGKIHARQGKLIYEPLSAIIPSQEHPIITLG